MDRTEKAFYLLLECLLFLPIFFAGSAVIGYGSGMFIALVVAHTLHWFLYGQFYILLKILGLSTTELSSFADYVRGLSKRAEREKSILAIAAFGSLSRKQLSELSDLDIRVIRRSGIINGIRANIFTVGERCRAFMIGVPLDVYVCDDFHSLSKMSPDESPTVLYDPQMKLLEYNQGK